MNGFDAVENRLLREIAPPPMSEGFADRVMASVPPSEAKVSRRDRRGGWRGRGIAMGAVAAGLLSVGAAASGLLGGTAQRLPVIATIAEAVSAKPVTRTPEFKRAAVVSAGKASKVVIAAEQPSTEARREIVAQRIADRIALRQARRAALGLPPNDQRIRRIARERLRQLPPEERRALVQRVREIRAERAAGVTPTPELRAERRARWREFRESLTPEQRERLREWRRQRRAMRGQIEPPPVE